MPISCNPQDLETAAACLWCIPDGLFKPVLISLLCQWANHGGTASASGYTMVSSFGWESGSLANSTTYFFMGDLFNSVQNGEQDITQNYILAPFSGTIKRFFIKVRTTTPGSAESVTHFVRINDTTDVAQVNLAYSAVEQHSSNTSVSQTVSRGDQIAVKLITPAWVSAPVAARVWACIYVE